MRVLVGTSGYSYAPWKGIFYPPKLSAAKMLAHYAGRLPTVEINNTFYRMPKADVLAKWASDVPQGFVFAIKSPKRITHDKRLVDSEEALRSLCEAVGVLGAKTGPLLFQLPPVQRKDLPRLRAFLETLRGIAPLARAAFEFRHESWFEDDVFAALAAQGAALCIAEDEKLATPLRPTVRWGYLRLRRPGYDEAAIARWADRLRAQPWEEAFVYFKHEDQATGPAFAEALLRLLR